MKKVDQVKKNGHIIQDYDAKLTTKQIDKLYNDIFKKNVRKDEKQHIFYEKIGVLTANVTYLGNPHPEYKKRIQLKDYYPDYYYNNSKKGLATIYVGIYTYDETQLFVVFESSTYAYKKSHNSSAHIFSMNLQYAQRTGEFSKIDSFGNTVHVFKKNHFIKYMKRLAGIDTEVPDYEHIMGVIKKYMEQFFTSMPLEWKGIDAYKEMISNNYNNARQNRWPGWYFEFLFQNYLNENHITEIKWNADKSKDGIDLDLVFSEKDWTYGDVKADQVNEDILGNNFRSFDKVVVEHNGVVYYICALYKAEKDSLHDYEVTKFWNSLRDADKAYTNFEEMKNRAGKAMKYSVAMKSINIIKIDKDVYKILKEDPFHQGVNSDGKPRQDKLKVRKDMISALSIYTMNY